MMSFKNTINNGRTGPLNWSMLSVTPMLSLLSHVKVSHRVSLCLSITKLTHLTPGSSLCKPRLNSHFTCIIQFSSECVVSKQVSSPDLATNVPAVTSSVYSCVGALKQVRSRHEPGKYSELILVSRASRTFSGFVFSRGSRSDRFRTMTAHTGFKCVVYYQLTSEVKS